MARQTGLGGVYEEPKTLEAARLLLTELWNEIQHQEKGIIRERNTSKSQVKEIRSRIKAGVDGESLVTLRLQLISKQAEYETVERLYLSIQKIKRIMTFSKPE